MAGRPATMTTAANADTTTLALIVRFMAGFLVDSRPRPLNHEPADVAAFMPLTLINPEAKPFGEPVSGPEGCLSFPEIYEDVTRPTSVQVTALNEQGQRLQFNAGGLLARAIQHETDHLNGILFIDRMPLAAKKALKEQLDALHKATKEALAKPSGP